MGKLPPPSPSPSPLALITEFSSHNISQYWYILCIKILNFTLLWSTQSQSQGRLWYLSPLPFPSIHNSIYLHEVKSFAGQSQGLLVRMGQVTRMRLSWPLDHWQMGTSVCKRWETEWHDFKVGIRFKIWHYWHVSNTSTSSWCGASHRKCQLEHIRVTKTRSLSLVLIIKWDVGQALVSLDKKKKHCF